MITSKLLPQKPKVFDWTIKMYGLFCNFSCTGIQHLFQSTTNEIKINLVYAPNIFAGVRIDRSYSGLSKAPSASPVLRFPYQAIASKLNYIQKAPDAPNVALYRHEKTVKFATAKLFDETSAVLRSAK